MGSIEPAPADTEGRLQAVIDRQDGKEPRPRPGRVVSPERMDGQTELAVGDGD